MSAPNLLRALAFLDQVGGFAELTTPFVEAHSVVVAAGATKIFTIHNPNGREGVLLNLNFFFDSEDYATSPVSLVLVGATQFAANSATTGQAVVTPFTAPVTLDGSPLNLTSIGGVWIPQGKAIGLQITNGETTPFMAWGFLDGITWSADQRRLIDKCGLTLPRDLFAGSPRGVS